MDLASLTRQLIDFSYPPACVACGAGIERAGSFCAECSGSLSKLQTAPFCSLCGMPVPEPEAPCPHCLGEGVPHFDRIIRLGVFRDPLKHLIHQMKYHRRWTIAELLAERLLNCPPARHRPEAVTGFGQATGYALVDPPYACSRSP